MSDNLDNKSDKSCCLCGSKAEHLVNLFSEHYKDYAQKILHLLKIEVCNTRSSGYICGLCTATINKMENFREKTQKFHSGVIEKIKCLSNNSTEAGRNGEPSIVDRRVEIAGYNLKRKDGSMKSEHSSKRKKSFLSEGNFNKDYLKAKTQTQHRCKSENFNMEHKKIKNEEPGNTTPSLNIIIMMKMSPASKDVKNSLPANDANVTNFVELELGTSNNKNYSDFIIVYKNSHGDTTMTNTNLENDNLTSVANITAAKRIEDRDKIANTRNPFPKGNESNSVSSTTVSNRDEITTAKGMFEPTRVQKVDKTPKMERVTVSDDKREIGE